MNTAELAAQLQDLLATPQAIGLGLLAGIAGHIVKKVIQARESNAKFSLKQYVTQNPYKVLMTFFYAVAGSVGLAMNGELSVYTAIMTGFAANSLSGASD